MAKPFSIQDYLAKNKIEVGSIKKEVGNTVSKGGHNDLRKTTYDVNIVDGKFDLHTHKEVITESKSDLKEGLNDNPQIIADIFARYMIGDREGAIRDLQKNIKNQWGHMEEPGKEWNDQFRNLVNGFSAVIKKTM